MHIGTTFKHKSFTFIFAAVSIFSTFTSLPTAQATSCTATLSSTTSVADSSTATMCILKISGSLSWTAPAGTTSVNILAVGGGGGADHNFGGGGGGGQVIIANSFSVSAGTTYSVIIGAGGAKGYEGPPNYTTYLASAGGDTKFGTLLTAVGGGVGGRGGSVSTSGGSSGGGREGQTASSAVTPVYSAPILTFGNNGGAGSTDKSGGGGGGAGGSGGNANGSVGGAGGAGLLVNVASSGQIVAGSGSTYVGAGGGGGAGGAGTGSWYVGGAGGAGGGGAGGSSGATSNGGSGTGIGAGGGGAGQGGSTQGGLGAAGALWISFAMPKPVPSVTFTSANSSFNLGTSNTLTATVVAGATGTITFTDSVSGTLCTTGSLNGSGVAACDWTPSSAGSYSITANYSGDSAYASTSSTSSTITVAIATATLLAVANQSLTYGAAETLTATIQVNGSTLNTNLGTVSFHNDGNQISSCQSVAILSGVATCSSWIPVAGNYSNITAIYSGAGSYSSSTSNGATFTVSKANQATLSVANQSFWAHQTLNLSLLTTNGGSGTGGNSYTVESGPCTISAGILSGNPTGPNGPKVCALTVTRAADSNYNAITSAQFTATMAFSFSRVGLALPSAATTATYGTPVEITATSFGQIPGTISFRAAGQTISGCTNKSVSASPWTTTCTWTPSASGLISLTYDWIPSNTNIYDSKTNWTPYKLATDPLGTTTPVTINVSKISTTNTLALSAATPIYGSIDTITATTSAPGTVVFKSSGVDISGCESVATTLASPYTAACPWIPTGVASYSLTAVLTPTDVAGYTTATATALTPTSVRSPLTITPTPGQTKVFGTLNPSLTYSITSGALVLSDTLSGELTYVGSDAGSYAISLGTLTNANNPKYAITLASESFTITKALQSAVSLSSLSSAYNPSNKTVSLTGSGGTGTGNYEYALHFSNTTPGCSVSGSTLTYTTAGTCVIAVTRTSDTNYFSRTDAVSFSIGLASQTITFGSLSAKN